jgi:hypothetical protein
MQLLARLGLTVCALLDLSQVQNAAFVRNTPIKQVRKREIRVGELCVQETTGIEHVL